MNKPQPLAAIILAAGQGTRMKSAQPKVLHSVAGAPMVRHVIDAVGALGADRIVVVVAPGMEAVAKAVAPATVVIQDRQLGTGHAVLAAKPALRDFAGDVLVLYGDTPLITAATLAAMLQARRARPQPAVVALGFQPDDPGAYGRLLLGPGKALKRIVEFNDATPAERRLRWCNGGVMAAGAEHLFALLAMVEPRNAKNEYYLTDVVGLARRRKLRCAMVPGSAAEVMGVNSRAELAAAEAAMQQRLRAKALGLGVTMIDPATVWLCHDTKLAPDVVIEPNVIFGDRVVVGPGTRIRSFSYIERAEIGANAVVGPFARLRAGTQLEAEAKVGNFVEIKNARIESGAKVNHLTYIGDARVGAKANIGAGTITCNYDGIAKHFTDIGKGAFIGSNAALVAPVKVGDGAIVGAGSVITEDVPSHALAVERAPQKTIADGASRMRARRRTCDGRS